MKIRYHIPAIIWAVGLMFIMLFPGNHIPKPQGIWDLISYDKLIHFALFAPLSFLVARSFFYHNTSLRRSVVASSIIGIIYAVSSELLQMYVAVGRNGNIYDAIADLLGVFIGLFVFYKKHKIVTRIKGSN